MRVHRLQPVWRRKFAPITDSQHDLPVFDIVLNRQFEPAALDQAWVADLTYIHTRCDLFFNRIHNSPHLSTRQYVRIVEAWVKSIGLDPAAYGTHAMRKIKATLV